ncbi:MAG: hypothetical protein ACI87H_003497 [Gammaproteobacteria bacterium]
MVGLLSIILLVGLIYRYQVFSAQKAVRFKAKELKRACRSGDRVNACWQIILWSQEAGLNGAQPGLIRLAKTINNATLATELRRLDASLYEAQNEPWPGEGLWLSYQRYRPADPPDSSEIIPRYEQLYAEVSAQRTPASGAF